MKKILILAILGIILISSVGCDTKTQTTISNKESKISNENKLVDEKINIENATDIDVEIYAAQVSIKSYDGEEVKVTGKLSQKSDGLDVKRNGYEIQIIEKQYKSSGLDMNGEKNISRLDILVPSKYKGNFKFDQGAGILDIEDIKAKNIDISGGSIKSKCENIKFDKLNLESGASKFDLNLKEKCGDIKINGGVGKLKLNMAEVGGNLEYEGGVGDIDIIIPENSPVDIITEKGDGQYNITAKTSDEKQYTFDLSVGIGSINVGN